LEGRAVISAWAPEDLARRLSRHAAETERSVSREIVIAVREHLQRADERRTDHPASQPVR
jgi:predicted transcriptional regulator